MKLPNILCEIFHIMCEMCEMCYEHRCDFYLNQIKKIIPRQDK